MANMQKLMKDNKWSLYCSLCGKNVFLHPLDYFMVKDKIWKKICHNDYITPERVLCRHCTEQILGRKLVDEDFTDAPINYKYKEDNTRELANKIYDYDDSNQQLQIIMDKLKKEGYDIEVQPNGYVYQINNVYNLQGITISTSPVDYRISFWQDDKDIQLAVKSIDAIYNFITKLTW